MPSTSLETRVSVRELPFSSLCAPLILSFLFSFLLVLLCECVCWMYAGSHVSYWPIQSSRGPVECLETLPTRDKKTKVNDLTFEQSREKPIDNNVVRASSSTSFRFR